MESSDLKSKLTKKTNIDLCVSFADETAKKLDVGKQVITHRRIVVHESELTCFGSILEVTREEITYAVPFAESAGWERRRSQITFDYEGSILSALKEDLLPPPILECKKLMKEVKSLDLLSPEYLRQRTRESSGSLGLGGQKLAAFLYELGDGKTSRIEEAIEGRLSSA